MDALLERITGEENDMKGQTQVIVLFLMIGFNFMLNILASQSS